MANTKQQKKRIQTDEKKRLRNKSFNSKVKTFYKKALQSIEQQESMVLEKVKAAVKLLDQAKAKKIKHRNYVNRKKSKLYEKLVQRKLHFSAKVKSNKTISEEKTK